MYWLVITTDATYVLRAASIQDAYEYALYASEYPEYVRVRYIILLCTVVG